jgi:uncharacterized BrkB/YihY/UPF0761 family membrane protein
LQPAFALRIVHRFQSIVGFDRATALASGALTALIPLALLSGTVVSWLGGSSIEDRIIERYDLTGRGADAVRDIFSPVGGSSTSINVIGIFLLALAVLSFTRAVQRLFEQTWDLEPLSVRNTANGLRWVVALFAYVFASGLVHALIGRGELELAAALAVMPLSAAFLIWSGWVLSGKRIEPRALRPFGLVAAVLLAAYSVGAAVYVPHLFSSYAGRYGVIGAVFAIISTLLCIMFVLVASAAIGREVSDELSRIEAEEAPRASRP